MNKLFAVLIVGLLIPPIIYGAFEQTYLRIAITLVAIVLTFFSEEHFLIRLVVSKAELMKLLITLPLNADITTILIKVLKSSNSKFITVFCTLINYAIFIN